jgi:RNA polymerase sigma-70 factor, ECF subfamily
MASTIAETPIPRLQPDAVARLDEAAFSELYRKTSRPLWAYVYRVTGHAADADDIVQEAFLRLLRGGPETDDEEQRRRFLYRVASNLVVDRWRAASRIVKVPAAEESEAGGADLHGPCDPDIARTFATLSTRDRALLWLAYIEGESHEEIAVSLGVGKRSVRVLLFRAKRRMRELLRSKGLMRTP